MSFASLYETSKPSLVGEPDWLLDMREQSFLTFQKEGVPGRKDESFKYTSFNAFNQFDFSLCAAQAHEAPLEQQKLLNDSIIFVFVNGYYQPQLSRLKELPEGVILSNFSDALLSHEGLVKAYLNKAEALNVFAHLNVSFMSAGYFLYVPKNIKCDYPIEMIFLEDANGESEMAR